MLLCYFYFYSTIILFNCNACVYMFLEIIFLFHYFRKDFIYLFERGEGREKKRGRNIDRLPLIHTPTRDEPKTQACVLTGNQTRELLLHRTMPNQLRHTCQGSFSFFTSRCVVFSACFYASVHLFHKNECTLILCCDWLKA